MIKIDNLFRDKAKNNVIYIVVAVGILLILLGNMGKPVQKNTETEKAFSRTREAELILSEIKGAGRVSVMISEGEEISESIFSEEEKVHHGTSVLIVADGGDDSRVREKIIRAASAALGVESHKIQVFERKD